MRLQRGSPTTSLVWQTVCRDSGVSAKAFRHLHNRLQGVGCWTHSHGINYQGIKRVQWVWPWFIDYWAAGTAALLINRTRTTPVMQPMAGFQRVRCVNQTPPHCRGWNVSATLVLAEQVRLVRIQCAPNHRNLKSWHPLASYFERNREGAACDNLWKL